MQTLLTPPVRKIMGVLSCHGFSSRVVGGAVRDTLLGRTPKDIDLCTPARPNEVLEALQKAGMRVEETGLQHGTVMAIIEDEGYEITTLRTDKETDGRHAVVEFVTDYQADAARRDFTFNAMSVDENGTLHDYFGGKADLAARKLRFVGDTTARIKEDYLRILRAYRFAAQHELIIHPDIRAAVRPLAENLKQISRERVWQETAKTVLAKRGAEKLIYAIEDGVSNGIDLDGSWILKNRREIALQANRMQEGPCPASAAALLSNFVPDPDAAEKLAVGWRMSKDEQTTIVTVTRARNQARSKLAYENFERMAVDGTSQDLLALGLTAAGRTDEAHQLTEWIVPTFPVAGRDLQALGHAPGPEMGRILKKMRETWITSSYRPSKEELLNTITTNSKGPNLRASVSER